MQKVSFLIFLFGIASANYFSDAPETFELVEGWYRERSTYYYDFGARSPTYNSGASVVSAPILVLITGYDANQNPIAVAGQHNIIDVVPGDAGYTDLWQVKLLTVSEGYVANTIRDYSAAISAFGAGTNGPLVNCPLVPIGSTLAGPGPSITLGWYQNQTVEYFDFGVNPSSSILLYNFPTFPDQHNIIDAIPEDSGYSAFWQIATVTPPSGYESNSARSFEDVENLGIEPYISSSVRNCPVVQTDEESGGAVVTISVVLNLLALAVASC